MTAPRADPTFLVDTADGARLTADLCLPEGEGPFPAVLIRTPYDRRRHRAELRAWASSGFAALAQDVRGRHASEGHWHPYRGEEADGGATVRRLREQPWSNGQVVAHGSSYGAHCALATALGASADSRPDAVVAAVPALGTAETARERGGPERLLARAGWWAAHGDRRTSDDTALEDALARDPRLLEHLPVAGFPSRLGRDLPSWPRLWAAERDGGLGARAAAAGIPLLAVGGTRDPFRDDTVELWRHWGGPSRLLMGPWGHALTAAPDPEARPQHQLNLGRLYVRWARAALAGSLSPGRHGVSALGGSGWWASMAAEAPKPTPYPFATALRLLAGSDFEADPERPFRSDRLNVPTAGHPDRCLLVTPPLPRPLDLLGGAEVRLSAVADTPAADWIVRLVALDPRGVADHLATGAVRRTDPAHGAARFSVPLGHLSRRLPAGTRLRIEVGGHHFPAHARNPHTGQDPVTATLLRSSRRSVRIGDSVLALPVVAARHRVARVNPAQEICR
ncbi:CocE/NonD family hydrolase [Streptomyces finlayi]|uniref:CocE/NonD family hydrolase n=1 Tax=Streptomyces finlayi TaxID=67296 RepID=A0A7G7BG09_9ACTN|nr:CocE/NonD family hydrolase [Streptomyces finlayi]QNE74274.1 CocE/NonD family hydrolase [Streptomyces finlayi]